MNLTTRLLWLSLAFLALVMTQWLFFPVYVLVLAQSGSVALGATALTECAHPECLTIQDEQLSSVSICRFSVASVSLCSIGYRDLACQNSLRGGVYASVNSCDGASRVGPACCTFHDGKSYGKPCDNIACTLGGSCFYRSQRWSCLAPDLASSSILGPPSLSVAFVNRVLSAYHSPAVGLGSVLYADSLTYGIDDAYPLAFFLHESSMGNAGMAVSTHSLGNIRCTPGWSCLGGYRSYVTWAAGFHDWFSLMVNEYLPRSLSTVATIIPVYAPSATITTNTPISWRCSRRSRSGVWSGVGLTRTKGNLMYINGVFARSPGQEKNFHAPGCASVRSHSSASQACSWSVRHMSQVRWASVLWLWCLSLVWNL